MLDPLAETPALLSVSGLSTELRTGKGVVRALEGVGFHVNAGEAVAIVGESGCGKSMTARSVLRVLPRRHDRLTAGRVAFAGEDLRAVPEGRMRAIRGARISMIFQDPMSHLDPSMRIGRQIAEVLSVHQKTDAGAIEAGVRNALASAQIEDIDRVMAAYPHQLSGGLRQRALIAMALACDPDLLIADEPTTALDVTTQRQILVLLRRLVDERGMGLVLITHDLGVVANVCDRVYVMYAGQVVEHAPVFDFFERPLHPYSQGLLASLRSMGRHDARLQSIAGTVPSLIDPPAGCRFAARCPQVIDACRSNDPAPTLDHRRRRDAACWVTSPEGRHNG
jgi:peptide/nickel transport system ATP-binding protein